MHMGGTNWTETGDELDWNEGGTQQENRESERPETKNNRGRTEGGRTGRKLRGRTGGNWEAEQRGIGPENQRQKKSKPGKKTEAGREKRKQKQGRKTQKDGGKPEQKQGQNQSKEPEKAWVQPTQKLSFRTQRQRDRAKKERKTEGQPFRTCRKRTTQRTVKLPRETK